MNSRNPENASLERKASTRWHLYVIRTVDDTLYAGVATNVERRFKEHYSQSPRSARYFRLHPAAAIAFAAAIGPRGIALKVEHWFKKLPRSRKEHIVQAGEFQFDAETGRIIT